MEKFFKELEGKIEKAVQKDVKKILKEVGDEKMYAAALVTDSDCITLYLAVNTYENMKKKDEKYAEMFKEHMSEEDIRKIKEGTKSLTKWVPAEWGYSDGKNSELNEISKLLYAKEESDVEGYEKNKTLFFEIVTSAFKKAIEAKCFGENSEELLYMVSMSDDEGTSEIENYSAKLLNSEKVYEEFLTRYDN